MANRWRFTASLREIFNSVSSLRNIEDEWCCSSHQRNITASFAAGINFHSFSVLTIVILGVQWTDRSRSNFETTFDRSIFNSFVVRECIKLPKLNCHPAKCENKKELITKSWSPWTIERNSFRVQLKRPCVTENKSKQSKQNGDRRNGRERERNSPNDIEHWMRIKSPQIRIAY